MGALMAFQVLWEGLPVSFFKPEGQQSRQSTSVGWLEASSSSAKL